MIRTLPEYMLPDLLLFRSCIKVSLALTSIILDVDFFGLAVRCFGKKEMYSIVIFYCSFTVFTSFIIKLHYC